MAQEIAMDVKVLGRGCQPSLRLYAEAARAIRWLGLAATLAKVEALEEIVKYPVRMTPSLIIDGEVKSDGRVPSRAELAAWLVAAARKQQG